MNINANDSSSRINDTTITTNRPIGVGATAVASTSSSSYAGGIGMRGACNNDSGCITSFCSHSDETITPTSMATMSSSMTRTKGKKMNNKKKVSTSSSSFPSSKDRKMSNIVGDGDGDGDDANTEASTMALLAQDLTQLSFQERNRINEEIHGVYDHCSMIETTGGLEEEVDDEDPISVNDCIMKMQKLIQDKRGEHVDAYNKAKFLAPTKYYNNTAFNLMFLRSTKFDIKAAATKIVAHFDAKAKLFGDEYIAKDIGIDDLEDDAITAMKTGGLLFLPEKDAAGRTVCFMSLKFANPKIWMDQLRANFYLWMTAIQNDEMAQKRGIVCIAYEVGCSLSQQARHIQNLIETAPLCDGIPNKVVSLHYCYSDSRFQGPFSFFFRLSPRKERVRFRHHCGGHVECQYALMSFGIPCTMLCVDQNGRLKPDFVNNYIETRRNIEAKAAKEEAKQQHQQQQSQGGDNNSNIVMVEVATNNDCLLGRGRPFQSHPGNIRLSKIIEEHQCEFDNASKFEKTIITWRIVKIMKDKLGARFLERVMTDKDENEVTGTAGGAWKVCNDEAARAKIAYGFRSGHKIRARRSKDGGGGGDGTTITANRKRRKLG